MRRFWFWLIGRSDYISIVEVYKRLWKQDVIR
jgi:hypothetical protein